MKIKLDEYQKLFLMLIGWSIISIGVYILLLFLHVIWGIMLYSILAGALLIAFTILNKGQFKLEKPVWDAPKKDKQKYKICKYLLLGALPLILCVLVDMVLLSFDLNLSNLFK